ncbi:MAG TPA: glucokinase [Tepidisphaeraceae bacterium]
MILAGDIGGTNTRLAVFDENYKVIGKQWKFPTGNGNDLETQIKKVFASVKIKPPTACLAMAGPVIENVCLGTNIGRRFVAEEMRKTLNLDSVTLINDLVANAAGVERLSKSELVTLMKGKRRTGTAALVSPGTGLGESIIVWDGHFLRPLPGEGGHARFAPTSELEVELFLYLLKKLGTVTTEDVVSGRGMDNLFSFYADRGLSVPKALQKKLDATPPANRGGLIAQAAVTKTSEAATEAMNLFVHLLGVEAASFALKTLAIGGVYLGGGIPPKILPLLQGPAFKKAFLTHRTMAGLLKEIPVHVILNDDTALEGAALYGRRFG